MVRFDSSFYENEAVYVAENLVGKYIVRSFGDETIRLKITETEAYIGEEDSACHARAGRTNRTEVMYESGGKAYVYLCYGIHFLLNVVTGKKDSPQAVLIRCCEGFFGPGRLTKRLGIDKSFNKEDLCVSNRLWIEDDGIKHSFYKDKRVGIDYAKEPYKSMELRFILKE